MTTYMKIPLTGAVVSQEFKLTSDCVSCKDFSLRSSCSLISFIISRGNFSKKYLLQISLFRRVLRHTQEPFVVLATYCSFV